MTLANHTQDYWRGYNAGRANGLKKGRQEAAQAFSLIVKLGAQIESSSQEKIVGLTDPERRIVKFYREMMRADHD